MNGSEVRAARKELGMTQAEFGFALGVKWLAISRIENGHRKVIPSREKGIQNLLALHRKAEKEMSDGKACV